MTTPTADFRQVLNVAGLEKNDEHAEAFRYIAAERGMHASGEYEVLECWTGKGVTALLERNSDGVVDPKPVLVCESPLGRVAVSPDDTAALQDVLKVLSS